VSEEIRGDVEAATPAETYVHGERGARGRTAQDTASAVGRRRDAGGERRMVERAKPRSYYGRPVVKPPVWKPEVPWYFFFGGLAGASAALGATASLSGNRRLARSAWGTALVGVSVSPVLLTLDLGVPRRFGYMLRVFKVTSPMSLGSWLLVLNGALTSAAAASNLVGFPRRGQRGFELTAGVAGLPLATYTGALISNSAVPVWSEARSELPFLFAAGSAASAGAAAVALTPPARAGPARRLAVAGTVAKLVVELLMERRLGELGEPYKRGAAGAYTRAGRALSIAGAVAIATRPRSRPAAVAGAALALAGGACERWAVFKAGFASAEDPRYTVEPQRRRRGD
jgi:formate-dependent nitrite reductase membrane component NrfD